jgi:N,N-dimethylformamidase
MLGGMWRRLGRPPNRLVGVGYSAQGPEEHTRGYLATAAAHDPRAAFLFEGVTTPVIGGEGPIGAAVGYEIDRVDPALGTPPHALVVARSQPFDGEMSPVNEERLTDVLLTAEDPLRADIVFYETPVGGAVFSVGSILFAGRLDEVNGAGKLASNALRRFADMRPFRYSSSENGDDDGGSLTRVD